MAASDSQRVLEVQDLHKTFRIGFFRKRVDAVRGVDFHVQRGESFGFVGPNGAGKTTTIKMILQLIYPTQGRVSLFGAPVGDPFTRTRLGYMPESPYVYTYLRPLEFLDLCGRLAGMAPGRRRQRADALIEQLGLAHAVDRPIGRFSKGMLQRIGMCQALLHEPEFLILDEPFSGLDPIGRKDIRDILLEQRKRGCTLFFTSHVLTDVELLCDRVAIIHRGKLTASGTMEELLRPDVRRVEIELAQVDDALRADLASVAREVRDLHHRVGVVVEGDAEVPRVLDLARARGASVVAIIPHRETLEDLFVRKAVRETSD
jgi:ABC-2 type transport system ATP-binding protein